MRCEVDGPRFRERIEALMKAHPQSEVFTLSGDVDELVVSVTGENGYGGVRFISDVTDPGECGVTRDSLKSLLKIAGTSLWITTSPTGITVTGKDSKEATVARADPSPVTEPPKGAQKHATLPEGALEGMAGPLKSCHPLTADTVPKALRAGTLTLTEDALHLITTNRLTAAHARIPLTDTSGELETNFNTPALIGALPLLKEKGVTLISEGEWWGFEGSDRWTMWRKSAPSYARHLARTLGDYRRQELPVIAVFPKKPLGNTAQSHRGLSTKLSRTITSMGFKNERVKMTAWRDGEKISEEEEIETLNPTTLESLSIDAESLSRTVRAFTGKTKNVALRLIPNSNLIIISDADREDITSGIVTATLQASTKDQQTK